MSAGVRGTIDAADVRYVVARMRRTITATLEAVNDGATDAALTLLVDLANQVHELEAITEGKP